MRLLVYNFRYFILLFDSECFGKKNKINILVSEYLIYLFLGEVKGVVVFWVEMVDS